MSQFKIAINGRFLTQRLTGVQRYAYEIVKHMLELNIELIVFVPSKEIFEGYDITGWPIIKVGNLNGQLWEQVTLPTYLIRSRFRGINYILLNLCNSAPLFFPNNAITIHDVSFLENPSWFKKSFVLSYKLIIPLLLKRAVLITTVSNFSKTEIEKYYPFVKGKCQVVYNAPTILPSNTVSSSKLFIQKHNLTKKKYILSVSSIEPRKNLGALVKAFKALNDFNLDLVLVGAKGKVFNDVTLDLKLNSRIKLLGYVTDEELSYLYANALCFVYPSLYEGFGLPPLEAMINECPVIVSDIPSLKEVCDKGAVFFNPNDSNDIRDKISNLINNDEQLGKLKVFGLDRARFFNWNNSASKMSKLLINEISTISLNTTSKDTLSN